MGAKLVSVTVPRCLGVLLIVGVLIFLSACSPTKTVPGDVPQRGEAGAVSIETVTPVTTTVDSAMITPQEIERPSKGNPKLESSLNQLLEAYHRKGLAEAQAFAAMHMMVLDDNRVQVEVVTSTAAMSDLIAAIEAAGGEYQSHYETVVQALVPIDALESLAQRPDVQAIREPQRAVLP
jgi:phosphoenolpyruvate-protein kinase (PTS system EI component)